MPRLSIRKLLEVSWPLLAALLVCVPFSYLLIKVYLDIGKVEEALLVTIFSSFLSGLTLRSVKSVLIVIFLSVVLAMMVGSLIIVYPLFTFGSEIYLTVMLGFLQRALTTVFFIILPFSLLFTFIGTVLAEVVP